MTPRDSIQRRRTGIVQVLWAVYFLDFIYSGLLRGFLPSIVSNGVFFLRAVVVCCLLVIFLRSGMSLSAFSRFFVFLSFLLTGFQLILYIGNQIDFVSFVYGLYLYVIPLLGVSLAEGIDTNRILSHYFVILRIALPINLLVSLLQTVFGFTPLYSAGFGAGLYSSDGVQRATGTFSSAAGLSFFVSLAFILLMSVQLLRIRVVPLYIWLEVIFLVIISGSRTTILNFGLLLLAVLVFRNIRMHVSTEKLFSKVFWVFLMTFLVTFPIFSNVYSAGITRFRNGNSINPPIERLLQQLSLGSYRIDLFGSGLGTRALGSVNNSDRRILYANWIEFDNARILVEAGLVFFILIWFAKIFFVFQVVRQKNGLSHDERAVVHIGIVGLCPYLFFAQIFGQGSLSSGVFLLMYIILSLASRDNSETKGYG